MRIDSIGLWLRGRRSGCQFYSVGTRDWEMREVSNVMQACGTCCDTCCGTLHSMYLTEESHPQSAGN